MILRLEFAMDVTVVELNELLKPSWGAEKWILEGWNKINKKEKELIKTRMDDLFKNGLPFELKHDKLLYIYLFSLLAQLEVLAIQVPLRFEEKMSTPEFKRSMRTQLLDEIFHGMVFTKIVYLLCAPYSLPPAYNAKIETLCDLIRNEECPKIGVVLLNLIAEGWIEEVFLCLNQHDIAPHVFAIILADEHRHVSEADLYREMGIPNKSILSEKLHTLEELMLNSLILERKYLLSITEILGVSSTQAMIRSIHEKHVRQLKKIKLVPGASWRLQMQVFQDTLEKLKDYSASNHEIEMTAIRKTFMKEWNDPGDPMMVGQFNIDVSCLELFKKKYPPETLTTLMLQASSKMLSETDSFRNYLSHNKLYQSQHSYMSIVVKLPGCGDHVGNIVFKDCHKMSMLELTTKIRQELHMMVYCYKKRQEVERKYPRLMQDQDPLLYALAHDVYPFPMPGSPFASLSSIVSSGYSQAISPLRKQETVKLTLLTVERKLVWSKVTETFETKDLLPASLSADHRVFDGNTPVPRLLNANFQAAFQRMLQGVIKPVKRARSAEIEDFTNKVDKLLKTNLEFGYQILSILQTQWLDYMDIEELFNLSAKKMMHARLESMFS